MMPWLLLLALILVLAFCEFGDESVRQPDRPSKTSTQELETDMAVLRRELVKLQTNPCQTKLRFEKLLGAWYITAPGAAAVPVSRVFPEARNRVIRSVEQLGAGDSVWMTELMKFSGDC